MPDKVRLTHPATGASFYAAAEAVESWQAVGWVRDAPKRRPAAKPTESATPVKKEKPNG